MSDSHSEGQDSTKKYMVGLRSYKTTARWNEPCGEACPVVLRFSDRWDGVGIVRWGGIGGAVDQGCIGGVVSAEDSFGACRFMWRLGLGCANQRCPNYGRSARLD